MSLPIIFCYVVIVGVLFLVCLSSEWKRRPECLPKPETVRKWKYVRISGPSEAVALYTMQAHDHAQGVHMTATWCRMGMRYTELAVPVNFELPQQPENIKIEWIA